MDAIVCYRFKRGDQVYNGVHEGVVSDYVGIINDVPHYRIVYSDPKKPSEMVPESQLVYSYTLADMLESDFGDQPPIPVCECGARFTSFPTQHMSWCPLSKGT